MSPNDVEILLVEDDPDDVELTLRALISEHLCNRIEVVRDGEEALDFLFCQGAFSRRDPESKPRLVLLDLKLPKLDGLDVLKHMKQHPATRAIPVVILTSSRQESDLVRGYQLGTNSYIQKPVEFEQFQATVKRVGYYWLLVNQSPPRKASIAPVESVAP